MNNSNSIQTAQELSNLKNQIEEMKQKLQKEVSEKIVLVSQRDEYQNAAKKLVSMNMNMGTKSYLKLVMPF